MGFYHPEVAEFSDNTVADDNDSEAEFGWKKASKYPVLLFARGC